MTDRVGQQLGNYQLIRLLGVGGFAEVYLGEHIHLGTQAAIKVLHTQLTSDDVDKFRTEARTIARLIHPHIVRVLEFGVEGKTPFLVMDYAPNGTLRQRHPKGIAVPLPLIVTYVKQVADALQYAHDEKLIHRDIKPENMLLGRRNDILLSDFGIALVAQSSRYQSVQEMAGTMAYMAPEQIQGKPRPASDQYSLGIVVYEWLSGDRPFHGSLMELVGQHLSVTPLSLQEKVSMISPEADQVILTALAKDPKQRFASVQVFATALEQASHLVQSYPPTSSIALPPQSKIGVPPPSQPSSLTNTVEAISPDQSPFPRDALIPLSQSSQSRNVVTPPSQSLQPTNVVTPSNSLSQPTVAATPARTPAVSSPSAGEPIPSGGPQPSKYRISRRAMVVVLVGLTVTGIVGWAELTHRSPVNSGNLSLKLPLKPGTTLYTYRGHTDKVSSVAWSPDGKSIVSGGTDGTVQVWDAMTGNRHLTYRGHHTVQFYPGEPIPAIYSAVWSPDGKSIASGGTDETVQVWDAMTGNRHLTYRGHEGSVSFTPGVFSVAWSPDGKFIASGSTDGTVQVWDARTGTRRLSYTGNYRDVRSVAWSPDGKSIASGDVADGTVQIWDAMTGNRRLSYTGNHGDVLSVAWSPDGKSIASGDDVNIVQVWQVE